MVPSRPEGARQAAPQPRPSPALFLEHQTTQVRELIQPLGAAAGYRDRSRRRDAQPAQPRQPFERGIHRRERYRLAKETLNILADGDAVRLVLKPDDRDDGGHVEEGAAVHGEGG